MHIASIGIDLNKTTAEQHSPGNARQLVGDRDHDLSPRCPRSAEQGSYAHNPGAPGSSKSHPPLLHLSWLSEWPTIGATGSM